MSVVRIKRQPRLRIVEKLQEPSVERVFGSRSFIGRNRNLDLPPVRRFPIQRTCRVADDDVWI